MGKKEIGSMTAKGGFINEDKICEKFMDYRFDGDAQAWLSLMGYDAQKIHEVSAVQIPSRIDLETALELGVSKEKFAEAVTFKKADIQLKVEMMDNKKVHVVNISLKKSNKAAAYNQVDKRAVLTYQKIWKFDDEVAKWLKVFTGEIMPKDVLEAEALKLIKDKKKRRLYLNEIPPKALAKITAFFTAHKRQVISDIMKGRGVLDADWFLVTMKSGKEAVDWVLKDIKTVCEFYTKGEVRLSPRASLKIGRVTMQRKGGTPDPTSLQFKINPLELFEI